jgi:Zn-dependent protease with chaperone function
METEDELASVLGHELEHVDRYHCAERAQIEAASRNLGIIGAIASLPVELFVAGYSKQQEFEADTEGVRLAVIAGYSPYGARDLMQRFAHRHDDAARGNDPSSGTRRRRTISTRTASTPAGEVLRVPEQTLSDYFRSHPPADERAAAIDALITREHWQSRRAQTRLRTRPITA